MIGAALEGRAFAKINLDLRILHARPDGYHELATVFQTIDLSDVVRLEATRPDMPFSLTCNAPGVPCDARNLVWKAATALWAKRGGSGTPTGVRVVLTKGIPAAGGLGGGSADAAVALALLSYWWDGPRSDGRLAEVAGSLGSDVPFFLLGGTALGQGRGERLTPWRDLPHTEVVLAVPPFGVSTPDAYAWYDGVLASRDAPRALPGQPTDWTTSWGTCRNDLEAPVLERFPLLTRIKRQLLSDGALMAMLSGSGSTVFGIFGERTSAEAAVVGLEAMGVTACRTRTVGQAEFQREAFGASRGVRLPRGS